MSGVASEAGLSLLHTSLFLRPSNLQALTLLKLKIILLLFPGIELACVTQLTEGLTIDLFDFPF